MTAPSTLLYPVAAEAFARGAVSLFELVGEIPDWLDEADDRDAVTQLDSHYGHGGGWIDAPKGWKLVDAFTPNARLCYPGDPPLMACAAWILRGELVILFSGSWVAVVQRDETVRVCRMD